MSYGVTCFYCDEPVDPNDRATYRRVTGWERKGFTESRRGGSDITLREQLDEYAHPGCIAKIRHGLDVAQAGLF